VRLAALGVPPTGFCVDHGLTGTQDDRTHRATHPCPQDDAVANTWPPRFFVTTARNAA
jgi:hypothetical protein